MRKHSHTTGLFGAMAATAAGAFGILLVQRVVQAERDAMRPPVVESTADRTPAIVVFGARTLPQGPSPELTARLRHALDLHQAGVGEFIIVSGGVDGELDEVTAMREWLEERGVPGSSILDGRPGGNTRETVATIATVALQHDLGPIVAVSSPFHARRIRDEAARSGFAVIVSGPPLSPETINAPVRRARILTEAVATAVYHLPPHATSRISSAMGPWRHTLPRILAGVNHSHGT